MARYLPLQSFRQIRLLRLETDSDVPERIQCELVVVSLDELSLQTTHPFTALSYVWGHTASDHEITLNGWSCYIRENLALFFSHYLHRQDKSSSPWLWIDALCIDQQNTAERNSQVPLMAEIYSHARTVLVWLGCDSTDGTSATITTLLPHSRSALQRLLAGPGGPRFQDALHMLFSCEYWSRTWIIQEFLLGRDVQLMHGALRISVATAEKLSQSVRTLWRERGIEPSGLELLSQRRQRLEKRPLFDLVVRNRAAQCQDQHDKIFAMLGLASGFTDGGTITVDYSMSLSALFGEVLLVCNVLEKDVFRSAYLLKRVLGITAASEQDLKSSNLNDHILAAEGYITGKVTMVGERISISKLEPDEVLSTSTIGNIMQNIGQEAFVQSARKLYKVDWPQFQNQISITDLSKMSSPPRHLHAISARSFPANSPAERRPTRPAGFAGVVVWFSGRPARPFTAGLSFGQCEKGDAVVQLPGFDIAFTISAQDPPHITSTLICAPSDPQASNVDVVTFEKFDFDFIQSPADCRTPAETVELRVTVAELLEILR